MMSATSELRPMILLDQSPAGIADRADRFAFSPGQLRTPLTGYKRVRGIPYAIDNGCFGGSLPARWRTIVAEAKRDPEKPLWVASPDVVGSARRTLELWPYFARELNGLPRALVLQDGIGDFEIPWHEIACVFIGGSDAFKLSDEAFAAARAAKILGKQVHVGRVNEDKRLTAWMGLADSIDGSGISRFDHMLAEVLDVIRGTEKQQALDLECAA
jgi:hypothetical protein